MHDPTAFPSADLAAAALDTRAVHAGRGDLRGLGVHALPIDLSTTYPLGAGGLAEATASLDAFCAGAAEAPNAVYARLHNPTVARCEAALAALDQTDAAVAFGSGMAALTAILLAARAGSDGSSTHAVVVRPLYGTSDHLMASGLTGVEATFVDQDDVAAALRPNTALVLVESIANPTLDLVDLAAVRRQMDGHAAALVVDATFSTPVLQRPAAHGADLVLHSATKYLGGHGDVMAGVVCTTEAWARRLRQVRVATGALLHPLAAYLLHRGLATLPLRVRRMQDTAMDLARRLAAHPAVERVRYPGLGTVRNAHLVGASGTSAQLDGPGTMLAFDLRGGYDAAAALLERVRLMTPAVSLGSIDTLVQHPAGLTHRVVDEAARAATGIHPGLVRLSVGLEDADDLWRDLAAALDGI